jgi:hypothetical protein
MIQEYLVREIEELLPNLSLRSLLEVQQLVQKEVASSYNSDSSFMEAVKRNLGIKE